MKRSILLIAAIVLLAVGTAGAEVVIRAAAVVNHEIITTYQLDREVAELQRAGHDAGRMEVLSGLIDETLIRQRITELGLTAGEEEIEAAIRDIQRQNNLTREQLEEALLAQGMTFAAYRDSLRDQIVRFKLIGKEVQNRVEVSNQDIRDYFRENIDQFREPASVHLARLTFRIPPRSGAPQIEQVRARAAEALSRLQQGEDFYAVLLSYSADRSAEGGDMGVLPVEDLAPGFARAVQNVDQGGLSEILETAEGFHILRVEERTAGKIRHFDTVKDEIRAILMEQKQDEGFQKWAEELRKSAFIDIRI